MSGTKNKFGMKNIILAASTIGFALILVWEKYWLYPFIGMHSHILYSHDIWQTGGGALFVVSFFGVLLGGTYYLMVFINRIIGGKTTT